MKLCTFCKQTKPKSEFSPVPSNKGGLDGWCKSCRAFDRREQRKILSRGEKHCGRCNLLKPLDDFYYNRHGKDRRQAWCKECAKAAVVSGYRNNPEKHAAYNREWARRNPDKRADGHLKSRLGLPHGTYAEMFSAQLGHCGICGSLDPGARIQRFHVDHDKETGMTRGLLCENCNRGIGSLQHSITLLESAISYIRKYNHTHLTQKPQSRKQTTQ